MPLSPCAACGALVRVATACPHCGRPAGGVARGVAVAMLLGLSGCDLLKPDTMSQDYGVTMTDSWETDADTDTDTDDSADSGGSGGT